MLITIIIISNFCWAVGTARQSANFIFNYLLKAKGLLIMILKSIFHSAISTFVRGGAAFFCMALLLAPSAVRAQSARLSLSQVGTNTVSANVSFTARASSISFDWGDGSSSSTSPDADQRRARLSHKYDNCGKKSVSVTVNFSGGGSTSHSRLITVGCSPAQPAEGGAHTCDIQTGPRQFACRPVPHYFVENIRAMNRLIEEIGRQRLAARAAGRPFEEPNLSLASFGYRCPDAMGNCPTRWLPSPGREEGGTRGLSNPNKFTGANNFELASTGFQRINAAGIGVKEIIDQNPIDAVDIWGEGAENGGEICFEGTEGRLIYLDARTSPRAQSSLPTTVRGNSICGMMPGPGSVVYLPPAR